MVTPRHTEAFTLRWQSVHTPLPAGFCFQEKGRELETMAKVICLPSLLCYSVIYIAVFSIV